MRSKSSPIRSSKSASNRSISNRLPTKFRHRSSTPLAQKISPFACLMPWSRPVVLPCAPSGPTSASPSVKRKPESISSETIPPSNCLKRRMDSIKSNRRSAILMPPPIRRSTIKYSPKKIRRRGKTSSQNRCESPLGATPMGSSPISSIARARYKSASASPIALSRPI